MNKPLPQNETLIAEIFSEDMAENMKFLEANKHKLTEDSDIFWAKAMVSAYEKQDDLSVKQKLIAAKLWSKIKNLPTHAQLEEAKKKFFYSLRITEMFKRAAETLKYPKIRYKTELGLLIFKLSAKRPVILIYLNKREEDQGKFLGDIDERDGMVRFIDATTQEEKDLVTKLLSDPDKELAIKGKELINCCFCGIDLQTTESRSKGYGPVCAGKWGLPWGEPNLPETLLDL